MTDSEIFDAEMKAYGGEVKPPLYAENSNLTSFGFVKALADNWIVSLRRFIPKLPEIYVGFVNNPCLNAAAFRSGGRHFVAVFGGTLYLFQSVFSCMMSDKRILYRIGDRLLEGEGSESLRGLRLDANEAIRNGFLPTVPKCPARCLYVERLFEDAMTFILLHELAHLAAGDTAYLERKYGSSFLFELPIAGNANANTSVSAQEMLTLQAMEMNADSQASIWLIDNARHQHTLEKPPTTIEESAFRRVFAMCTFFRMFGDTVFTADYLEKTHPHPRFRQVLALTRMWEMIAAIWTSDLIDLARTAINSAAHEVESSFSLLTGEPIAMVGLHQSRSEYGAKYLKMLASHYVKETIPILQPYAHFDLKSLSTGFNRDKQVLT
jgi:hypothetical protein